MSASPVSSSGGDNKPNSDQIHFKFCRECSNLLYPKEDRVQNRLMFTCRTCHVSEPATSPCVYQNNLNTQVGETAGVTQDVGSDPTVGDPEFCLHCGEELACSQCGILSSGALSDDHYSDYDESGEDPDDNYFSMP
ncbi:DNA directed RNA polymerase II 15 kDa subunit, putative [Talaromyces stipitatus ATCC 10500]|uniref:DNA directed RNA polymerase II 15 kDa subunit, putative n=1 Tax=Talaromyces stipitatus (strain ATCC 10500 / CBS 375.48 / QM 6759 / NRRL 1006) TaxID=441959 RepID=B8M1I8_TALSN|nr:DNA directed RNA polymerase II 15 kDa subunit, putative [Talaromyces stipitatus ATCC 10500]EED21884.1 DNA directed RNA polymerase II 15 kDa subunit, putative [Talaromyces stipitatus ATCC 10500]